MKTTRTNVGFTLIEMAMVLMIVALVLGGLLPTISSQIEQQRRSETRKQLVEIQQALMGFAILNGRLPCPMLATMTNPANANYGLEVNNCSANTTAEGLLPWKTLGVAEVDAWGSKRTANGDSWNGYWRYRPDRNFTTVFALNTGFGTCPSTTTDDCLVVQDSNSFNLTSASERPVAIVFSTGLNLTADGQNGGAFQPNNGIYQSDVSSPNFDDILVWISRPQLFNRMIAAGKLP